MNDQSSEINETNNFIDNSLAFWRGEQLRPTIIILSSTLLMLAWKYFGSKEFYYKNLVDHLVIGNDVDFSATVYFFLSCLTLLGLIPALIVKFGFKEKLADYGVRWGDLKKCFIFFAILAPGLLLVSYFASSDSEILLMFPYCKSSANTVQMFLINILFFGLFYVGWEFHFRGFLMHGMSPYMSKANAILFQALASSLIHIGNPALETFGAISGGLLLGVMVIQTRSLLAGFLIHYLLGVSLDYFIIYV